MKLDEDSIRPVGRGLPIDAVDIAAFRRQSDRGIFRLFVTFSSTREMELVPPDRCSPQINKEALLTMLGDEAYPLPLYLIKICPKGLDNPKETFN